MSTRQILFLPMQTTATELPARTRVLVHHQVGPTHDYYEVGTVQGKHGDDIAVKVIDQQNKIVTRTYPRQQLTVGGGGGGNVTGLDDRVVP